MLEKLCGDAVQSDFGHVHQEQTQIGLVSSCNLPPLCQPKALLLAQLALLSHNVPPTAEE